MKKTSIGTWAYNVGPYGDNPIPFDTVGSTLSTTVTVAVVVEALLEPSVTVRVTVLAPK